MSVDARETMRGCVSVLFGGAKLVFVEAGILTGAPGEGSPAGKWIRPSWLLMPSYLAHICAPRYTVASRANVSQHNASEFLFLLLFYLLLFFLGGTAVLLFFVYYFVHPLTRAAGRISQKRDIDGAICFKSTARVRYSITNLNFDNKYLFLHWEEIINLATITATCDKYFFIVLTKYQ